LSLTSFLLLTTAAFLAGGINSIAGAGSLLTFPALLTMGLPPLSANVSNSIGLVPGSLSGAWGYRSELRGHLGGAVRLCLASGIGGLIGATLLLRLPTRVFELVVPALVAVSSILVLLQRWITMRLSGGPNHPRAAAAGVLIVGIYGGYFGAAQGIMLLAVLGLSLDAPLVRTNAYKTLVAAAANGASGVVFIFLAPVSWPHVAVLAVASVAGGRLGAAVGLRVPERPLRLGIATFGLVVAARLALDVRF
jgi:uncharacterized membrane protein YfcA